MVRQKVGDCPAARARRTAERVHLGPAQQQQRRRRGAHCSAVPVDVESKVMDCILSSVNTRVPTVNNRPPPLHTPHTHHRSQNTRARARATRHTHTRARARTHAPRTGEREQLVLYNHGVEGGPADQEVRAAILESEYGRGLYYASDASRGREIGYYDGEEVTEQEYCTLDEYTGLRHTLEMVRGCAG